MDLHNIHFETSVLLGLTFFLLLVNSLFILVVAHPQAFEPSAHSGDDLQVVNDPAQPTSWRRTYRMLNIGPGGQSLVANREVKVIMMSPAWCRLDPSKQSGHLSALAMGQLVPFLITLKSTSE